MMNLKRNIIFISLVLLSGWSSNSLSDSSTLKNIDTSKAMVSFNPYVSVLDQYNLSRYEVNDLVPFVAKIATRFQKIHIDVEFSYLNGENSLERTPFAVASYNCLHTTKRKIEVFLEFSQTRPSRELFPRFLSLADKVNAVCNGTVVSLLLNPVIKSDIEFFVRFRNYLNQNLNLRFNYSLGYSFKQLMICNWLHEYDHFNVDFVLVKYNEHKSFISSFAKSICGNFTGRHILLKNDLYITSFAFDYYSLGGDYSGEGWWFLLKDSATTKFKDFVFEERISLANNVDFQENPKNFTWLQHNHSFDGLTTGIVSRYSFYYWPSELKDFCKLVTISDGKPYLSMESYTGYFKTQRLYHNHCLNFSVYHMPIFKGTKNESSLSIAKFVNDKRGPTNISIYTLGDTLEIKYGYAFSLDECGSYKWSSHSNIFLNTITQPNIQTVLFHFFEDKYLIELETPRLVQQRTVMFENCMKIVNSLSNVSMEIGFVSVGYFKIERFYSMPVALQKYVKYIYLLENWAKSQTNIVVFLGQFKDEYIDFAQTNSYSKNVVGWMRYDETTGLYISKREEALKISMVHYPQPIYNITEVLKTINLTTDANQIYALTGSQVFFVVGIPLIGVFLVALVSFLVYHYGYKKNIIGNAELDTFMNGDEKSESTAQSIPYDKEKHEISENNFKFDSKIPLGTGEFGAVYSGTIESTSGSIKVAVKTSNPLKIHKTQLAGLLSEIKVLAYIGKHANITELVGANTSSLKRGKVYIFLEFCHFGSLLKYLQEVRVLVSSPIQETNVDSMISGNNYKNALASKQNILDDALSKDLYRWSTEICNGMAFLAKKHIVHADLATRNVLLNLRREAKICDFGLSRRMYNYTNYVKTQQEPLPWKWMAPESLNYMEFNEKTDVWAYGVTLWEIYSLGRNPYPGLSWDINFSQLLEQGLRLSEPEYCERDMYERMQKCWNIRPESRPTFSELLLMTLTPDD